MLLLMHECLDAFEQMTNEYNEKAFYFSQAIMNNRHTSVPTIQCLDLSCTKRLKDAKQFAV